MNTHESSSARSQESLAVCPWVCHSASQHLCVLLDVAGLVMPVSFICQYFYKYINENVQAEGFRDLDTRTC